MAGPVELKSQKSLLTRYGKKLERILSENENLIRLDAQSLRDNRESQRVQSLVLQLHSTSKLLLDTLKEFTSTVDSLGDAIDKEQMEQVQEYLDKTHNVLERAHDVAIKLESDRLSARDHTLTSPNQSAAGLLTSPNAQMGNPIYSNPKLPAIPIPTFSGQIWEYQNFWTLFAENVHNQPLSKLQKFNYLVKALRGKARESVRRFPITEENCDHAVDFLRTKYGNSVKFIACLQSRLEKVRAESTLIHEQRRLLESIIPIVTQLEKEDVHLNGSFVIQKVLSKFSTNLQRKVLAARMDSGSNEINWTMKDVICDLDKVITTEERIEEMMSKNTNSSTHTRNHDRRAHSPTLVQKRTVNCIFCDSNGHKSLTCQRYPTSESRKTVLREKSRCFNCSLPGHFTQDCKKQGCNSCNGKKHHYTLCPQRSQQESGAQARFMSSTSSALSKHTAPQHEPREEKRQKQQQRRPVKAQAHVIETCIDPTFAPELAESNENPMGTVLSTISGNSAPIVERNDRRMEQGNVLLLTGVARIKDKQNQWKDIEVLLDTGANQSFISEKLAQELDLRGEAQKKLLLYFFGNEVPIYATCMWTSLDIWDQHGDKHSLRLLTTPVLTAQQNSAQLNKEDLAFIAQQKIQLSKSHSQRESTPQILLGCDQLWDLLDVPFPRFRLPSGLLLLPSKLGYLLTGCQNDMAVNEKREIGPAITVINSLTKFDEELEQWDKHWRIDSAGVNEFTGTINAEKEAVNAKVAHFFEQTIEKRENGYYVRFPFKEHHPPLPSNRAIALKRLRSVLQALAKTPQLLQEYNNTFVTQQEKGIIEEIPDNAPPEGSVLHYIPHQPVLTPHKDTTKLRIVFDASAHFKDSPSLNDTLHQGPLILPEIYAMLLRFRIPKYAVTSDVEKAFLQVHLHEADRDATRFFWVKDIQAPPEEDNLATFRFTRVTFGLNVSPYLLGATIHHHLRCTVQDRAFAEEIRENLYVDNLVLSASTKDEAAEKALLARRIFEEMGMNLREFSSNDQTLHSHLPEQVWAKLTLQKVLGISWDTGNDQLNISCSLLPTKAVTKRQVARQIASIYDPLGWLVPLLTRAKKFQQDLWKQKFDWDEELPLETSKLWDNIVDGINGFEKSLPRRFSPTHQMDLAVFADASEAAIAACAYIFGENTSTLAMAKGKLPSLKAKTTIPKLELNALTLAMRLAYSITQALKSCIPQYPWTVYLFSDSQIVLKWLSTHKSKDLGVLITNRLHEIRKLVQKLKEDGVEVAFGYVNTSENPADAGTRGLPKTQLDDHVWWHGPDFLKLPVREWRAELYALAEQHEDNVAAVNATVALNAPACDLFDCTRYGSLTKGKRVVALVLRFVKRLLRPLSQARKKITLEHVPELGDILETSAPLQGEEIRAARFALIRDHQRNRITKEYKKSMENTLQLYQDNNLIWRSKGRIGNSELRETTKHPIFIAPNTPLATLIILEAHGDYHKGIEHTIAAVREQYWIPKIRQQARKLIAHCIKCRRFNALPYRYPDTTDLPKRRVWRTHPFQHTGLDFFDLPQCVENGEKIKPYGCTFTCSVTRLIHLKVVKSTSTVDFLNALRRFIARRGCPESITCDNAPTFLLSANILSGQQESLCTDIVRSLTNKEIRWSHITQYAPWQGGFYERLIKSVKHALYKALRGSRHRTLDDTYTFITEVEACLNSRPLTYQTSEQGELSSVRPIDFLHHGITLTLPLDSRVDTTDDPEYLPPDELRRLRHREQAIEALQSPVQETETFWNIWQNQYLTSLRETQKKTVSNRRLGKEHPRIGDIVLISDPVLPRNEWKMARITQTKPGSDGEIREAELVTATKRKIRRPVNLLIPLELSNLDQEKDNEQSKTPAAQEAEPELGGKKNNHYNLRPRLPAKYVHNAIATTQKKLKKSMPHRSNPKWFLFHIMLFSLARLTFGNTTAMRMACTATGVQVDATESQTFEICAEHVCEIQHWTSNPHLVKFPPDIILHDHNVILKWHSDGRVQVIETTCRAMDFCTNIECNLCLQILLNPECWPLGAIVMAVLILYIIVAFFYILLYVPMTIGKPIRLMLFGIQSLVKFALRLGFQGLLRILCKRKRPSTTSRRARIAAALAIILLITVPTGALNGCQQVNIMEHQLTTCREVEEKESCTVTLTELLKINTLHRQACLRLVRNDTLVGNLKVTWKGVYLHCERETLYFTRSIDLKVIDSKRCPGMGSCHGQKCADINGSSLIPELKLGNEWPGRTGCWESCGWFGCGCGWPSSGCLFYRVFATPKSPKIYEVFHCMRWVEETKLEVILEDLSSRKQYYIVQVLPNVPVSLPSLQLTMTMVTIPPMPALNTEFITDGTDTSIWRESAGPNFYCKTWEHAKTLHCSLKDGCECSPAESSVHCECPPFELEEHFNQLTLKLPIRGPFWELRRKNTSVVAKIPHMVSSEIVVNFHHTLNSVIREVRDFKCVVENSILQGCYHCLKGAIANVRCTAEKETLGEVLCTKYAFVISCAPHGPQSTLRFHLGSARQLLNCTITCGSIQNRFRLSGILKYVTSPHSPFLAVIAGKSNEYNEWDWPDFNHIVDSILSWYKTLSIVLMIGALLLLCAYAYIGTIGLRVGWLIARALWTISCLPFMVVVTIIRALLNRFYQGALAKKSA